MIEEIEMSYRKKLAAYEYEKKKLIRQNLTSENYELELAKIIERLKI